MVAGRYDRGSRWGQERVWNGDGDEDEVVAVKLTSDGFRPESREWLWLGLKEGEFFDSTVEWHY